MSHVPHELAEEFPAEVDKIHRMRSENAHFAKLADQYHDINRQVHRSETDIEPKDDFAMIDLRKRRAALKDEIARLLAEG